MDFKGNSLDDGPGIRSVIFFKGCNLSCVWCHNPESKFSYQELSYEIEKCVQCKECIQECPNHALSFNSSIIIDRNLCNRCFRCVQVCNSTALQIIGKFYSISEILAKITPYHPYFKTSHGGVTISGGEATLYMDYLHSLVKELKRNKINILLETNGLFDLSQFRKLILPYVNIIYIDLKFIKSKLHKKYCGQSNTQILANFKVLYKNASISNYRIISRTSLIPNITDTDMNLRDIRNYLESLEVQEHHFLLNNAIWSHKCEKMGYKRPFTDDHPIYEIYSQKRLNNVKKLFKDSSIKLNFT